MLTPLRNELAALLADVPARRRPTIKRTDAPDMLLATDLPMIADEAAVAGMLRRAEEAGWTARLRGGWILLDHPIPMPEQREIPRASGEAGCCLSLLQRHPGGETDAADIRMLAKAVEAGVEHVERLCAAWHKAWAERLRNHQALPGGLMPWLCRAVEYTLKEETT